jgi:hypothetical protein
MMTANTPSLKASMRPLVILPTPFIGLRVKREQPVTGRSCAYRKSHSAVFTECNIVALRSKLATISIRQGQVPSEVRQAAENISEEEALRQLGDWVRVYLRRGHRSAS